MDFSTKAREVMPTILAEEVGRLIEEDEIRDLEVLKNGIRKMLKKVGSQTYGKVLEKRR